MTATQLVWVDLKENMDNYFLVVMGLIIYFMQCGFAFLEAGAVRSKNTVNILMKNILDSAIGGIVYWICGYAFAFGDKSNAFIGYSYFCLNDLPDSLYPFYFFHFVFAATAATIVSGCMAERTRFSAYFMYSVAITGVVYPIVSHWAWSGDGWLASGCWWDDVYYMDFAGSGVVHCVGGTAGLMGALALGRRLELQKGGESEGRRLEGHSVPLACLGGFILFFGFFAFNGGSQAAITNQGDSAVVGKAIVNTILSGSFGGLGASILSYIKLRKFSLLAVINGILTGMVAICAGANAVETYGAAVTGLVAGMVFFGVSELLFLCKVDDPLDAFAVHYGGGAWGVLSLAFLHADRGVFYEWDALSGKHLVWQVIGLLAITAWTAAITGPMFFGLRALKYVGYDALRVPVEIEREGLDVTEHGMEAYPNGGPTAYGGGGGAELTGVHINNAKL